MEGSFISDREVEPTLKRKARQSKEEANKKIKSVLHWESCTESDPLFKAVESEINKQFESERGVDEIRHSEDEDVESCDDSSDDDESYESSFVVSDDDEDTESEWNSSDESPTTNSPLGSSGKYVQENAGDGVEGKTTEHQDLSLVQEPVAKHDLYDIAQISQKDS